MKAIGIFSDGFRLYADSSAHRNGQPLFLPDYEGGWAIRLCPAIRMSRLGMHISEKFASRYYDAVTVAAMAIPANNASSPYCQPERFFAMDAAYAVGLWREIPDAGQNMRIASGTNGFDFSIDRLGVDRKIAELSEFMTFKMGDLLLFADPSVTIHIAVGDRIDANLCGEPCLDIKIK